MNESRDENESKSTGNPEGNWVYVTEESTRAEVEALPDEGRGPYLERLWSMGAGLSYDFSDLFLQNKLKDNGKAANNRLTQNYVKAIEFAIAAHGETSRKGSDFTYLSHLLGVSSIVLEMGGSEDEAIAALLHDTIEDTATTRRDLEECFNAEIARMVAETSELILYIDEEGTKYPSWRGRKLDSIKQIDDKPADSVRITLADKLHNARSIVSDWRAPGAGAADYSKFNAGKEDQHWYYREISESIRFRRADLGEGAQRFVNELVELVDTITGTTREAQIGVRSRQWRQVRPNYWETVPLEMVVEGGGPDGTGNCSIYTDWWIDRPDYTAPNLKAAMDIAERGGGPLPPGATHRPDV